MCCHTVLAWISCADTSVGSDRVTGGKQRSDGGRRGRVADEGLVVEGGAARDGHLADLRDGVVLRSKQALELVVRGSERISPEAPDGSGVAPLRVVDDHRSSPEILHPGGGPDAGEQPDLESEMHVIQSR